MPIIDSGTGKIIKDYSLKELEDISRLMRVYMITAITLANSGHTGGCMSIADIAAALYFKEARHDPKNPAWENRDRIFWSAGHKAPALYAALGIAGYYDIDDIVLLRRLFSPFEGHPNRLKLPGVESSSGSLGQGLGIALGSALSSRLSGRNYRVYCIMGDGELNEGSVWEAAMSAAHYNLSNIIAVVDRNHLQIDGLTEKVMEIEPLADKWRSFGWTVFECNGHDIKEILSNFKKAHNCGKPAVLIMQTIKGKNISYAENICSYHGICPKDGISGTESLEVALSDLNSSDFFKNKLPSLINRVHKHQEMVDNKIKDMVPAYKVNYFWNTGDTMKVDMIPNRMGFGSGLEKAGEDPRVVALGADITDSIKISSFYINHPERLSRFFSLGIAEANMTVVAAGFAKEGYIPFMGSYGVFVTGRNWDQLRTTVCYNNYNVKIVDAHGGISVGPDGATHQALEDITNLYYLPNMRICVPADSPEAEKATLAIKILEGPAAIRIAREATPVITGNLTPYEFGTANIIRYRKAKENFIEAFDFYLSKEYKNEYEDISIIGCGPIIAEAMRAAYILAEEYKISARVINMHTVKPMDKAAIISAAAETKAILTCEEHQVGGFGNIVAGIIATEFSLDKNIKVQMVGVQDRFGQSGAPWELMKLFGLTAEFIAEKAVVLLK